jgi:dihydroorotase
VHFCHISRKDEIEWIASAKKKGFNITCEVTPHHLFMNENEAKRLGPLGDMRPRLGKQSDVDALWEHINTTIDCVASDHAPHTLLEKQNSINPPPGVPGLESTLPLMLNAAAEGRLSYERLVELLAINPRRIYGLPKQIETWVEIDPQASYIFPDHVLYTKCGWSPFSGYPIKGQIRKVVLRGKEVYTDGIIH